MWYFWLFFLVLLAVAIVLMYCCLVRAGKMDDEMEETFRKLSEKRKDETELWQGEDQERFRRSIRGKKILPIMT